MQLFSNKLEFEAKDFEYTRTAPHKTDPKYQDWLQKWEEYYYGDPEGHFIGFQKEEANRFTISVNKRLNLINARAEHIRVFSYIWVNGTPKRADTSFSWVPLKNISSHFVPYRCCGNLIERNDPKIPHYNTLIGVLKKLEKAELIQVKRDVINKESTSDKKRYYTFYRISDGVSDSSISYEEKYKDLIGWVETLSQDGFRTHCRYMAACEIMEDNGIVDPGDEIEKLLKKQGFDFAAPDEDFPDFDR